MQRQPPSRSLCRAGQSRPVAGDHRERTEPNPFEDLASGEGFEDQRTAKATHEHRLIDPPGRDGDRATRRMSSPDAIGSGTPHSSRSTAS